MQTPQADTLINNSFSIGIGMGISVNNKGVLFAARSVILFNTIAFIITP